MCVTICLLAKTLRYPSGGGHFWAYLNWALGLKALGCTVLWAEAYGPDVDGPALTQLVEILRHRLAVYGLTDGIALLPTGNGSHTPEAVEGCLDIHAAASADLLLNFVYDAPGPLVQRFRRSALVDIDPGLLQHWMKHDQIRVAPHDLHFTIGETVGMPGGPISDVGRRWVHTPPCVNVDWWSRAASEPEAAFTTVTHWWEKWMTDGTEWSANDKRAGFQDYIDVPRQAELPMELAVNLTSGGADERDELERHGWRICNSTEVAGSPQSYQEYIRSSRAEFSCAKPWYVRLNTAWISDRTLCYLASAKPAVVQHTGPSRLLPEREGLLRFRTPSEAVELLREVALHYEEQSAAARALVERHFDSNKVVGNVLDAALH